MLDGQVTHFDLALEPVHELLELRGRVTLDGAPPGPWAAMLWVGPLGDKSQTGAAVNLDGDGRFELATFATGDVRVVLTAVAGELDGARIVAPVSLAPGVTDWSLELRTAEVHVTNVRLEGDRQVELCLVSCGEQGVLALRPVLASGESRLVIPAGQVKLWRFDPQALDLDPHDWPALAEALAEPGAAVTLHAP